MPHRLILLRHGHCEWSDYGEHRYTGWYDSRLIEIGREEAREASTIMMDAGLEPTVVHTSRLDRAVETAEIVLRGLGRSWIDVRRSWRLNSIHWGDFTGVRKTATWTARKWRERMGRSVRMPPIRNENEFNPNTSPAYRDLPPELIPRGEGIADVEQRVLTYWHDVLVPDLRAGHEVLVAAHGKTLKALIMHLDPMSEDDIDALTWRDGVPFLYELGDDMMPIQECHPLQRTLDPDTTAAAQQHKTTNSQL